MFKQFLFRHPRTVHDLLDKLARTIAAVLKAQIEAGCQAVQVFDSWAGILGAEDYREFVLPYNRLIFDELAPLHVPRILFSTYSSSLLEVMRETGADVISLDWRIRVDEARQRLGPNIAVQGNLDPGYLFMEKPAIEERVRRLLAQAGGMAGHIFNLGHGVLPGTPPENAKFLVDLVHQLTMRA
jgi:uroporphyrinogen decarboxylase